MEVRGIHHPGIVVPDLEAAVAFYGELLGMTKVYDESWEIGDDAYDQAVGLQGSAARGVQLRGTNTYLELWQFSAPIQTGPSPRDLGANELGFRHLALEVDDVAAALERLKALGGSAMNEPVWFADDDAVVYARDPFGNIIELTTAGVHPPMIAALISAMKEKDR